MLRPDHCYVIAEFGSNHLGDLDDALRAIYQAKKIGADAIKFQLFRLSDILVDPSQGDARTELPVGWLPLLAATCREHRIDFLCTPFAPWAVEALNPYVEMWKIGSFEHKQVAIWEACSTTKKPIIASRGRGEGSYATYPLYCISKYPAHLADVYLPRFGEEYVGLSDHTKSTVVPALAVARGARIIEKHFRLDATPTDSPDYGVSITTRQFAEMADYIRVAETTCWRQPPADRLLISFPNRREDDGRLPDAPIKPS